MNQFFPGYLFVEIVDGQRWVPINSTNGIAELMTRKPSASEYFEPSTVPDDFINRLMNCSHRNDEDACTWRLEPGTKVRVLSGPFADHDGEIASWSGTDRCRLVLWLLNRDTVVEVSAADIMAID